MNSWSLLAFVLTSIILLILISRGGRRGAGSAGGSGRGDEEGRWSSGGRGMRDWGHVVDSRRRVLSRALGRTFKLNWV